MVAKSRNVNAGDLTGLQDRHALGDFDGVSVHENLDRIVGVGEVDSGAADGGTGRELGLGGGGWLGALEVGGGGDHGPVEEEPCGSGA